MNKNVFFALACGQRAKLWVGPASLALCFARPSPVSRLRWQAGGGLPPLATRTSASLLRTAKQAVLRKT
jgi:hypothetical protein